MSKGKSKVHPNDLRKTSAEDKRKRNKRNNAKRVRTKASRKAGGLGIRYKEQELKPKQIEWIKSFCQINSVAKAADAVGVKRGTAKNWSEHPVVIKEINKIKKALVKKTGYNLMAAMKEAEHGMDFALECRNPMAYAKILEIKAKMHALLIDKRDITANTPFQIVVRGVRDPTPLPSQPPIPQLRDTNPIPVAATVIEDELSLTEEEMEAWLD